MQRNLNSIHGNGIQLSMEAVIFGVTNNDGNLAEMLLLFLPLSSRLPSIDVFDIASREPLRDTTLRPDALLLTPNESVSKAAAAVVFGNGPSEGKARLSN